MSNSKTFKTNFGIRFLGSGSRGNAALIKGSDNFILLDAGLSSSKIKRLLKEWGISIDLLTAIIVTHGHGDHTKGLKAIASLTSCPILATRGTLREISIPHSKFTTLIPGKELEINGFRLWPFNVPHDSNCPIGIRLDFGGQSLAIATDLGHITSEAFYHLLDADILCIESNYDEDLLAKCSYPNWLKMRIRGPLGHLSNKGVRGILSRQKKHLSHLALVHLSQESNSPDIVRDNIISFLQNSQWKDLPFTIVTQDEPTDWISI